MKVALARTQIFNNSVHRPATIQRIRLGASPNGTLAAIAHESGSGNSPGGRPETAPAQTRLLYAGANRLIGMRLAELALPEGNSMRAPGEAPGMMALEIAMDEMAEKLGMDPIEFRAVNGTQIDPENPARKFSHRDLIGCMRLGADRFGWNRRTCPLLAGHRMQLSTFCPARGPKAMRYVQDAACSDANVPSAPVSAR